LGQKYEGRLKITVLEIHLAARFALFSGEEGFDILLSYASVKVLPNNLKKIMKNG